MVASAEGFIVLSALFLLAVSVLFNCGSKKKHKARVSAKTHRESQRKSHIEENKKKTEVKRSSPQTQRTPSNPVSLDHPGDKKGVVEATQMDGTEKQKEEAENKTDLGSTKKKGALDANEDRTAEGVPSLPEFKYSMRSEEFNESKKSKTKSKSSQEIQLKKKSPAKKEKLQKTDRTVDSEKNSAAKLPRTAGTQNNDD